MRVVEFGEEDTQERPEDATSDETVYEIVWTEEESAGGELVLRVTPVRRARAAPDEKS
jgi:hypothetical protein